MNSSTTLRQQSPATRTAIYYITVGTLATIWGGVWMYYLRNDAGPNPPGIWQYYVCTGVLLSGVAVTIIGLMIGRIGQEAQNADVPVGEVAAAVVKPTDSAVAPVQTVPGAAAPGTPAPGTPAPAADQPVATVPIAANPPQRVGQR